MQMEISWPKLGITVDAEMLDFNQALAQKFWQTLPFKSIQLHAMVTGEDLYAYSPVSIVEYADLVEKRIPIDKMPVGYVAWSPLGLFAIYYGPCTEPLQSTPIACIPKRDHEKLIAAGRAVWNSILVTKDPIVVEVRAK